ncbi:MAG: hypothetical protein V4557_04065 [Bacteroidota bacterium]
MDETNEFLHDASGRPIYLRTEYEIEGTPFYADEYCTANLKIKNGKYYTGIKVKLNLQENLLIYIDREGKEMAASTPVEKIEFFNCSDPAKNKTLVSGFPAIDKQDVSNFYVRLDSGNVSLLKYIFVNYRDEKKYGSANMTRVFEQKEVYYIYTPGKGIQRLNKDNNAVIKLLGNKKTELEDFIAKNDIKCRKEEELVKVFTFYNSLK